MYYCPHCGNQIFDDSMVCPSCGGDLPLEHENQSVTTENTYSGYDSYQQSDAFDSYGSYQQNNSYDSYGPYNPANEKKTVIIQDGPKGKLAAILFATIGVLIVSSIICVNLVSGYAKNLKGTYVCESYIDGYYYDFYMDFEDGRCKLYADDSYDYIDGKYSAIGASITINFEDDSSTYVGSYNKKHDTVTLKSDDMPDMVFKKEE